MSAAGIGALCGTAIGLGLALGIAAFRTPSRSGLVQKWTARIDRRKLSARGRKAAWCAGAGAAVGIVTGWPVAAVAGAVAAWWLPGMLGPDRTAARQAARIEAVACFAEMLRDTLAAASGIGQGIGSACRNAPGPIAAEAAALASRIDGGMELTAALSVFADEVRDPTCDVVVVCLSQAVEHSARDLTGLLGSLAATARAQAAGRQRIHAARAQIRTGVRIMTAVTLGMLVGLFLMDRDFLAPYDTAVGQLVLAAGLGLFAIGYAWLYRMSHPPAAPRLLTRTDDGREAQPWW